MAEVIYDGMAKDAREHGRQLSTGEVAAIVEGAPIEEIEPQVFVEWTQEDIERMADPSCVMLAFDGIRDSTAIMPDMTGRNHGTIYGNPEYVRPRQFDIDRTNPLTRGMSGVY